MQQLAGFDNHRLPFLSSERDAIDVENANDYYEMVINLANSEPDKIKILMNMKAIRSSCKWAVSLLKHCFGSRLMFKFVNSEMSVRMKTTHQLMIMMARYSSHNKGFICDDDMLPLAG
jgi:hypothetical protein